MLPFPTGNTRLVEPVPGKLMESLPSTKDPAPYTDTGCVPVFVRLRVLLPVIIFPLVITRVPATVTLSLRESEPPLIRLRLLNVVAPVRTWAPAPLKATAPVPALKVEVF